MAQRAALLSALLAASVRAQQACTSTTETKPSLSWSQCTSSGCTNTSGSVVIDANWRWTHDVSGYTNCYTGNTWDADLCPDDVTCAANCCVDGADYESTYGVTSADDALTLNFVTQSTDTNVGSRLFLMASDTEYQMFDLLGKEFTFDVDVSNLPCGLNGALYFVSMDADGGMARYSGNKAGAAYGTGYCDSQCPRDIKFIGGEGNVEGWTPSTNDANSGVGGHGSCCAEMDIWEANLISTAVTPHPCENSTQTVCDGDDCGGTYSTDRYAGTCDPDGCDFNPYRQGVTDFYGAGAAGVDTSKVFTVVTQFIEENGALSEIKRFYVQDGVTIANPDSTMAGTSGNSITADYCTAQKEATNTTDYFTQRGGLEGMGTALANGMVLVMSLWDDHYANMLWLDSTYPADSTEAGAARGTCATSSGVPSDIESNNATASVIYSNIKFGDINSTFTA
ncbi:family 7 glycoside hydrolase [Cryphonectria parasitica EP155]|uniref:Glucanase n=1 Tax=Cryphonectria parasitica (strain ATCC 38755 / EP155) TaxID=660469 RepID=A0A9P4XWG2_CRYP1|nr:family 7 glycoside hydrolase [Cryphonectria parasitica EP155]KAF3761835.1 family 7 glycoside hydrolase [Cryphonectria parasitica EP155]